eukprot:9599501-Alexandrium_andersonii.AAC.1
MQLHCGAGCWPTRIMAHKSSLGWRHTSVDICPKLALESLGLPGTTFGEQASGSETPGATGNADREQHDGPSKKTRESKREPEDSAG